MNTFGNKYRITIFGESHSKQIGVVIDGCPAGIELTENDFVNDLSRRRPNNLGGTSRNESDRLSIVSGVFNGFTTGAAITITVANDDVDSSNYALLKFRPGHSDFTAYNKYKGYNDYRGGGMFSGRTTVALVIAGVVAKKILKNSIYNKIDFNTKICSIGGIKNDCSNDVNTAIKDMIVKVMEQGDSVGGIIECCVSNVPVGFGAPYFDSIESMLSHIIFAIPGIKGIEFGDGFEVANRLGSAVNDVYISQDGATKTNHCGGINGGISNGNDIIFRVAVRPTASIMRMQTSYNFVANTMEGLSVGGRHDACFALRLPVIIEASAAIVFVDFYLLH